jgi:hypothetical protein
MPYSQRAWNRTAVVLSLAIVVSACAADIAEPQDPNPNFHTVNSKLKCLGNDEQKFDDDKSEVGIHLVNTNSKGDLDSETSETDQKDIRQYLRKFLQEFQKFTAENPGKPKKLLIYINGGLNSIGGARNQMANQISCMERDGYFPAFLIWRTEALATYGEQIGKVRNGVLKESIQSTSPLYIAGDLGVGLARAPVTFYNSTGRYIDRILFRRLSNEYDVETAGTKSADQRYDDDNQPVSDKKNIIYANGADDGRSDILGDALYTLTAPFRLVTTPFTDSLGRTARENMLRRSRVTIRSAWEFQQDFYEANRTLGGEPTSRADLIKKYERGTGTFARFFQELAWCRQGDNGCWENNHEKLLENTEITVIAHSMGAIVIDQILSQFMDFKIDNIVYMGSATTTRSFLTRAGPYLRKYPSTRFYNLMLHPLAEVRETTFGGLLPSGSLLEWIDDMFENPKTLADRTFGKWRNVALTKDIFPKDIQDQMLFKIFGFQEGHNRVCENGHVWPDPITHGAFNDTRMFYWHPRFWARNSGKVKWAGAKASRPPEILCPSG